MTGQQIINETRFLTKTDTETYSDDEILNGINYVFYPEIIIDILRSQGYRNLTMEHAYADLVDYSSVSEGEVGYKGEYAFPSDLLRLKRIEIDYGNGYKKATIYSENENSEYEDTDLLNTATAENPVVRFSRDSFFVRPLPTADVTDGIYIEYEARQSDLTTTTSPAFEQSFHYILVLKSAIRYAMKEPAAHNALWERQLNNLTAEMRIFYRDRFRSKFNLPRIQDTYE